MDPWIYRHLSPDYIEAEENFKKCDDPQATSGVMSIFVLLYLLNGFVDVHFRSTPGTLLSGVTYLRLCVQT